MTTATDKVSLTMVEASKSNELKVMCVQLARHDNNSMTHGFFLLIPRHLQHVTVAHSAEDD